MTKGFDADWLALREPADRAARDEGLARRLAHSVSGRDRPLAIVDLGCGTGSNLRGLSPYLPHDQVWRLVDHDPALLACARDRLAAWADRVEPRGDGLLLHRGSSRLAISFERRDLATVLDAALGDRPDVVTASALLDLLSRAALERLAEAVAARRAAFLAVLTYDGRETWWPEHEADSAVQRAFLAHQGGDKGFGPSAGHRALESMAEAFERLGYATLSAPSPWRLGPAEDGLRRALAQEKAKAAEETGLVPPSALASWLGLRLGTGSAIVGHTDLLAMPPPSPRPQAAARP